MTRPAGNAIALLIIMGPLGLFLALFAIIAMRQPMGVYLWSIMFCVAGFILFLVSKLTVVRRGQLTSFGTADMTPTMGLVYRLGYSLMAGGGFALILLFALFGRR